VKWTKGQPDAAISKAASSHEYGPKETVQMLMDVATSIHVLIVNHAANLAKGGETVPTEVLMLIDYLSEVAFPQQNPSAETKTTEDSKHSVKAPKRKSPRVGATASTATVQEERTAAPVSRRPMTRSEYKKRMTSMTIDDALGFVDVDSLD
jgi:hypothetical protein